MTANLRSGDVVEIIATGEKITVGSIYNVYESETPRYKGDSNPIPAGTITVRAAGAALYTKRLRPGSYRKI